MPELTDPRLTAPDGQPTPFQVTAGVAAIRAAPAPDAEMVTQALHGETLQVFSETGEFGQVQLDRDRYVGWVLMEAVSAPALSASHRVGALRTYVYSEPDLKSAPHYLVSLNARMVVEPEQEGRFVKCARSGWVVADHLAPLDVWEPDPASVAERFVGTPYLWGGRESLGLDCTGLTVAAFGACGVDLPRDSDMQFAWAGAPIDDWDRPGVLHRGDLVFWKGHVGILTDDQTLIHANAHHMCVARESLSAAIERIAPLYGPPIGARRLNVTAARGHGPDWLS